MIIRLQVKTKPPSVSSPFPPKTTSLASNTLFSGLKPFIRTDLMYAHSRSFIEGFQVVRSARRRRLRPHQSLEPLGNQAGFRHSLLLQTVRISHWFSSVFPLISRNRRTSSTQLHASASAKTLLGWRDCLLRQRERSPQSLPCMCGRSIR